MEPTLKEAMSTNVKFVPPTTKICDAARLMKREKIGSLPVIENGKVLGVITDRDMVVRVLAASIDPEEATVQHAMTRDAITALESDSLDVAIAKMAAHQVSRILVENHAGQVVGVISAEQAAAACKDSEVSTRLVSALFQAHEKPPVIMA